MSVDSGLSGRARRGLCFALATTFLASAIVLFFGSHAVAQNNSSWRFTGSMSIPRRHATVTLLPNGKVLVAGGNGPTTPGTPIASAEIYDPTTEEFILPDAPDTSLQVARTLHTATLLPNGTVLIVGGWTGAASLSSAEIYNPTTGTFALTGPMTVARSQHTATLLADGRVLVVGGWETGPVASAEIYNPTSGTFTPVTGSLATARNTHTATRLGDGSVLITGGFGPSGALASAEIFSPASGTFSPGGTMLSARGSHAATLLSNGSVLLSAGNTSGSIEIPVSSHETYTPGTGPGTGFHSPVNDVAVRFWPTTFSHPLAPGALVAGGGPEGMWNTIANGTVSTVQLVPTLAQVADMQEARWAAGGVVLPNQRLLIVGGGSETAELFCPAVKSVEITALPTQTVDEGQSLNFAPTTTLCDNDGGFITAEDLPVGASFEEGIFTWTPGSFQAGTYFVTLILNICPSEGDCFVAHTREVTIVVNDAIIDTDGDGVPNGQDNCPDNPNPGQANSDAPEDNLGDVCDPDPMGVNFNNTATTTTTPPSPPLGGGGFTTNPNQPIELTGTVTFSPPAGENPPPYFVVRPTPYNLIPRVKAKGSSQFIDADRVPEGLPVTFSETGGDLVEITATTQLSATINFRDWYTTPLSLPPGEYELTLEYVNFVRDPALNANGVCVDPANPNTPDPTNCFSPIWVGIAPAAAQTIRIGVDVAGGNSLLDKLIEKVQGLQIDNKTRNGLLVKLIDAKNHLNKGQLTGACGKLKDFVQAAQAASGKAVPANTAAELIADAQTIMRLLGCK